jgi:hypothetical protein
MFGNLLEVGNPYVVGSTCSTVLPTGESCSVQTEYLVQPEDDDFTNTVEVHYNPSGFPNDITDTASDSVDIVHPDFTVTKTCLIDPVPVHEPATFEIVIANTGDIPLIINTNEPQIPADQVLPVDGTLVYQVTKEPELGAFEVYNEVIVTATLPEEYGLDNVLEKSDDAVCQVEELYAYTPGFWKNHTAAAPSGNDAWQYTEYDPEDYLCDYEEEPGVFECGALTAHIRAETGDNSLLGGLILRGGRGLEGASEILLRAAVASLLNANLNEVMGLWTFYYTEADVIALVNGALAPLPGESEEEQRIRIIELAEDFTYWNEYGNMEFDWNWPLP